MIDRNKQERSRSGNGMLNDYKGALLPAIPVS